MTRAQIITWNPKKMSMFSVEQVAAIKMAMRGKSFFMTGPGGTGKSHVIAQIRRMFDDVQVTASTGVAAENIAGSTIYSFSGIGIGKTPFNELIEKIKYDKFILNRWLSVKILIIDEISIISGEIFTLLDRVARFMREKPDLPFGGIQVIAVGDFLQLPPPDGSYAFQSDSWKETFANRVVFITKVFRQNDPDFVKELHDIRVGVLNDSFLNMLEMRSNKLNADSQIVRTSVYSLNKDVDTINSIELDKLPGPVTVFKSNDFFYCNDNIKKSIKFPIESEISLKPGAQVIMRKNTSEYKNGSRGVVTSIRGNSVNISLLDSTVTVKYEQFEIYIGNTIIASRSMLPIKLGWAVSIHRSQGMSLDYLKVDLTNVFSSAQAYTALSRARTLEGLEVIGLTKEVVYCDPIVLEYYKNLQNEIASSG